MRASAGVPLILVICLLPVACRGREMPDDMALLSQILGHPIALDTRGGFTVVSPMTTLAALSRESPEDLERTQNFVRRKFKVQDKQIDRLLDALIQKNEEPVRLELTSSPEDGYVIDFDGKFTSYFEDGLGAWERWYEENPKADGLTQVSLPAVDPRTGLVLVYMGTQYHWTSGAGYLILYRYADGKLQELERVMLWIS